MLDEEREYREALEEIVDAASSVLAGGKDGGGHSDDDDFRDGEPLGGSFGEGVWNVDGGSAADDHDHEDGPGHGCSIKQLPRRLLVEAAQKAMQINPANALGVGPVAAVSSGLVSDPLRIAVLTAKYWGPQLRTLTVSFMESPPADLRRTIVGHMNAWSERCGIRFAETRETGHVRITLGGIGYWSYLGTDITLIPRNQPTMGLQGFSMRMPDSEFRRVVRHEAGHTLGMPHEHPRRALVDRIDPRRAYPYFLRTQGWDKATVDAQVLTPLDERTIFGTPADEDSIMCYQLPGEITRNNKPIRGGTDINETDYRFAARIYPPPGRPRARGYAADGYGS